MVTHDDNPALDPPAPLPEDQTPAEAPETPPWQKPELWMTLAAMLVGFLLTSDFVKEGTTLYQMLTFAAVVLAALGYKVTQAVSEAYKTKAKGEIQAARLNLRAEQLRYERARFEEYRQN